MMGIGLGLGFATRRKATAAPSPPAWLPSGAKVMYDPANSRYYIDGVGEVTSSAIIQAGAIDGAYYVEAAVMAFLSVPHTMVVRAANIADTQRVVTYGPSRITLYRFTDNANLYEEDGSPDLYSGDWSGAQTLERRAAFTWTASKLSVSGNGGAVATGVPTYNPNTATNCYFNFYAAHSKYFVIFGEKADGDLPGLSA